MSYSNDHNLYEYNIYSYIIIIYRLGKLLRYDIGHSDDVISYYDGVASV
jgi:hypothetical protein